MTARQVAKRCRKQQPQAYGAHVAFQRAVVRWGEAKKPGPNDAMLWALRNGFQHFSIPGDGHCLYSAVGFHVHLDGIQVRTQMAEQLRKWIHIFSQADPTSVFAAQTMAEIKNKQVWGGENQILVA